MPEQITKYPDVTIQVLRESGARCGQGVEKKILTACPAEKFCSLPAGEICVYGLNEVKQMTQVTPRELAGFVCPPGKQAVEGAPTVLAGIDGWAIAFAAGALVTALARRKRGR